MSSDKLTRVAKTLCYLFKVAVQFRVSEIATWNKHLFRKKKQKKNNFTVIVTAINI